MSSDSENQLETNVGVIIKNNENKLEICLTANDTVEVSMGPENEDGSGFWMKFSRTKLLSVLKYVKDSKYSLFILETNGILFGSDRDYVKRLREFKEKLYVRVSFKAARPEGFTKRTGALGEYYELPFKALEYLLNEGINARAAAMTDPMVMPQEERQILIEKLQSNTN